MQKQDLDTITKPTKEGYYFDGWYADPACMERVSGKVTVNKDTVFYGKWINTTAPGVLNSDNHMAYVAGYEDGTVRPENFVTREEIAAILAPRGGCGGGCGGCGGGCGDDCNCDDDCSCGGCGN